MTVDLHIPTGWKELTSVQLRYVVELAHKELSHEKYLLVLFCSFAGIKMVAGTADDEGKKVVKTRFKTADGTLFDLEDWQVSDFCSRLSFLSEEQMPIDMAWPFKWDPYLMDTTFGDWFHADALMMGYSLYGNLDQLKGAMKDLGDPREDLQATDPDVVLLQKWYECFKDWLHERYPYVFRKADDPSGSDVASSPIEARQNIMLMLNDGRPQDNEAIERSNVHDVFSALQRKIEEAKHIEEQMNKMNH